MSDEYSQKRTPFEATADVRAVGRFRDDPDAALRGGRLASAEGDPEFDRSLAIMRLVEEEPERFLELVGYLPHAIQDIFYQYYLLGRTQEQINQLIGLSHQADVSHALRVGVEAVCAVIAGVEGSEVAGRAYQAMLEFRTRPESRGELVVETGPNLGSFEVSAADAEGLVETFVASWSVYGPRSAGG